MQFNLEGVADKNSLLQILAETDIDVPARTEGRRTEHTEKWIICRLLSTLASLNKLEYPVNLIHRDRPDFLLTIGSRNIGIEFTEAISRDFAEYCAPAEREFPDTLVEPGLFRWGVSRLSVQDMRELLKRGRLQSNGWDGDIAEEEWALYLESVLRKKLEDSIKENYEILPGRYLAIYDNLPMPYVYLGKAVNSFVEKCDYNWEHENYFNSIFVEHGPVILEINKDEAIHHELNDLW